MDTQYIKRPGERAAWLAARLPYYGQSQVGAIFNLSPWETPIDLFLEKTGRQVRNYGYMVTRGHALADVDRLVVPDGEKVASHHAEIRAAGILECKTARDEWRDGVPLHYQLQAQGYCELLDLPWCDFSVVFKSTSAHRCPVDPGWEFLRVERDRAVGARIMREIEAFAELVARDEPPPVNGLADARDLFPHGGGEAVEADADTAGRIRALRKTEADIKQLTAHADKLRGEIAAAMGDADALTVDGKTVCTFRAPKPTDKIDFKAAFSDLALALHADAMQTAGIISKHRTLVNGARRFLLKAEGGASRV